MKRALETVSLTLNTTATKIERKAKRKNEYEKRQQLDFSLVDTCYDFSVCLERERFVSDVRSDIYFGH